MRRLGVKRGNFLAGPGGAIQCPLEDCIIVNILKSLFAPIKKKKFSSLCSRVLFVLREKGETFLFSLTCFLSFCAPQKKMLVFWPNQTFLDFCSAPSLLSLSVSPCDAREEPSNVRGVSFLQKRGGGALPNKEPGGAQRGAPHTTITHSIWEGTKKPFTFRSNCKQLKSPRGGPPSGQTFVFSQ